MLSPMQLATGTQPNISHLRIFGCAVYVPIAPPQRTKMGPQRRLGIYVGFDSPSIIRYLEPLTGDAFKARFDDCVFNESLFPALGNEISQPKADRQISWTTPTLSHFDPRTRQNEEEVLKILHIRNTVHQFPDAFTDNLKIVKSHIPAANTPARIDIPEHRSNPPAAEVAIPQRKRGRPQGSKDKLPRKKKFPGIPETIPTQESELMAISSPQSETPKELNPVETEISLNFVHSGEVLDRKNTTVKNKITYHITNNIASSK